MKTVHGKADSYFTQNEDIGIIGHGESIESCFSNMARVMFSLITDVSTIHPLHIISFEFKEADPQLALVKWLTLLIEKSVAHHLIFGEFHLKQEGEHWKATVAGEVWANQVEPGGLVLKGVSLTLLSVKKMNQHWEAQCLLQVDKGLAKA